MSARVPTRKQYGRLAALGNPGTIIVTPSRREWEPLRRNGWTRDADAPEAQETYDFTPGRGHIWPQRITPAGLRALADAMERYEGEGGRG